MVIEIDSDYSELSYGIVIGCHAYLRLIQRMHNQDSGWKRFLRPLNFQHHVIIPSPFPEPDDPQYTKCMSYLWIISLPVSRKVFNYLLARKELLRTQQNGTYSFSQMMEMINTFPVEPYSRSVFHFDSHPWAVRSGARIFQDETEWKEHVDHFIQSPYQLGYQPYDNILLQEPPSSNSTYSISLSHPSSSSTTTTTIIVESEKTKWQTKFNQEYDVFKEILAFLAPDKYPSYHQRLHEGAPCVPRYGDWLYLEFGHRPGYNFTPTEIKFRKTRLTSCPSQLLLEHSH